MIKQILFDCAGVLTHMNFRGLMQQLSGSEEIAELLVANLWRPGSPWHLYDKGEINSLQVVEKLESFLPAQLHPYLQPLIDRLLEAFPPMDGMEALVDELHSRGYRCYLLSNFPEPFDGLPSRTPALQKLDGMVVSYRIHMLKPDPAIFQRAAEILGIEPGETIFIDDSPANVEGAKTAGMEGYRFTSPADLKAHFQKLDILN